MNEIWRNKLQVNISVCLFFTWSLRFINRDAGVERVFTSCSCTWTRANRQTVSVLNFEGEEKELHIHMYFCSTNSHLQWLVACCSCLPACATGAVELEVWTELKTAGRRETERWAQQKQNRLNKHEWMGLNSMLKQELICHQVPTILGRRSGKNTVRLLQVERLSFIQLVKSCNNS